MESLVANEGVAESELFIFCDGPKKPEYEEAVREVHRLVKSMQTPEKTIEYSEGLLSPK